MTTTLIKQVYDRTLGDIRSLRKSGLFTNAHECMFALTLFDAGEPVKMSVAANTVGIARASMTSMVDRLSEMGLVERINDESDRRSTLVKLTQSGVTKVYNALEAVEA